MGLLTGLITLPLAPVRGTMWIAERLAEEAERQAGDEPTIRRRLAELELRHELGELDEDELAEAQDRLLARLNEIRQMQRSDRGR